MNWKTLLTATATVSLLAACASTPTPKVGDQPTGTQTGSNASGAAPIVSSSSQNQPVADPLNDPSSPLAKRSVFFDFDAYVVKSEFKPTVSAHAEYLKSNAAHKVVIQGNTDARGSREYNLGLGQRRAESVKQAMQVLGVPEKQLEAVSLGKEKLRATGSSEADDAQNRRADIVYDAQ